MILRTERIGDRFADLDKVNALALEAFPPEEYLAPSKLIEMSHEDGFDFWALYDGELFVGFICVKTHRQMAYLFFLAIDAHLRGHGYGGSAIETLRALYPDYQHVVDFEMQDDSAPNCAQRNRRRNFYLRNGYKPCGRFLSYLGVDYEIFCMNDAFDFEAFQEMLSKLKIDGFHPVYF